jgi:starch-binding outer membrane protein, SusD/RagB family
MIKNNIKKWLVITLITPLIFTACTKEWLDKVELTGASVEDVYFADLTGISQLVTGTYAAVNPVAAGLHNLDIMYLGYGSFASDDAEAGGEAGGADIIDFQNWDKGIPSSSEPKGITENNWAYNYKCIMRSNMVLKGLEKYRTDHGDMPADSAALVNQFEGEMRFIRAFVHFKLTQIYGGIPVVDHILGSTEYNLSRKTVAECLHFVQDELLLAIPLLPIKGATEVGRATKGAAQSLLAKAYLYESSYAENYAGDVRFGECTNKYADALAQAQAVINSGQYKLMGIDGQTFDTYWNQNGSTIYPTITPGYRYIFTVDGEASDEMIWTTQAINDQGNYLISRGSYLNIYMACRNTGVGEATAALGWGFNCPTDKLLNAFEPGDPRKIVTIAENEDSVYLTAGWNVWNCMASPTYMYTRKFEVSPDQYWGTRNTDGNGPTNFPYIRYADVVLMAAEAAFKTGDAGTALTYVNMVRTRARNGAVDGVPANLSSITFDGIIKERQLELACEGHRFFDLVRWKRAEAELVDQPLMSWRQDLDNHIAIAQTPLFTNRFTAGVNEFFPLPAVEVINCNGSLVQYDGYK